jgi:hypothetical protein
MVTLLFPKALSDAAGFLAFPSFDRLPVSRPGGMNSGHLGQRLSGLTGKMGLQLRVQLRNVPPSTGVTGFPIIH